MRAYSELSRPHIEKMEMGQPSNGNKAKAVYDAIAARSVPHAMCFEKHFNETVFANTTDDELELLNRFWRLQLIRVPSDTIEERECLAHTTEFSAWLNNFKRYVVPTVIKHDLPVGELK